MSIGLPGTEAMGLSLHWTSEFQTYVEFKWQSGRDFKKGRIDHNYFLAKSFWLLWRWEWDKIRRETDRMLLDSLLGMDIEWGFTCDKEGKWCPQIRKKVWEQNKSGMLVLHMENRDFTCLPAANCVGCLGEVRLDREDGADRKEPWRLGRGVRTWCDGHLGITMDS